MIKLHRSIYVHKTASPEFRLFTWRNCTEGQSSGGTACHTGWRRVGGWTPLSGWRWRRGRQGWQKRPEIPSTTRTEAGMPERWWSSSSIDLSFASSCLVSVFTSTQSQNILYVCPGYVNSRPNFGTLCQYIYKGELCTDSCSRWKWETKAICRVNKQDRLVRTRVGERILKAWIKC